MAAQLEAYFKYSQETPAEIIRKMYDGIDRKTRALQTDMRIVIDSWRLIATPQLHQELNEILIEIDQWILFDMDEDDDYDEDDEPDR